MCAGEGPRAPPGAILPGPRISCPEGHSYNYHLAATNLKAPGLHQVLHLKGLELLQALPMSAPPLLEAEVANAESRRWSLGFPHWGQVPASSAAAAGRKSSN